jgi:hypothetical protein
MEDELTAADEELGDASSATDEKPPGHGPGFRLGLLLGMAAGAAAAVLFAPASGEENRHRASEAGVAGDDVSPERLRDVLDRVRARVQEAADEAREATRLAEEEGRARYRELTGEDE